MAKSITNYGKNWSFQPRRLLRPGSVDEIQEIVRGAAKVRVMGAGHSWSEAIVTDDTLLSLDDLDRVLSVDRDALQVTVQAGIRLKDLISALEQQGLALANLGSIAEQSVAGATATGTHGTGLDHRCLADQVQRIALVDGHGERRVLDRAHPDFDAVAVGLGGFGVIHEMTLSVVPAFQMHAVTEALPFDQVLGDLDRLLRSHDHFKLWWIVPNEDVVLFRQDHTDAPRNDSDLERWFKDEFLAVLVYRPLLQLQKLWRDGLVVWTNRVLGGAYAKRFERTCKSHVAFLTPSPPVHHETEYAFDRADAKALLEAYRELMLGSGYTYSFIQELRFTRADPFWLSPSYGRDSIWLSMYNIDTDKRWRAQRELFEDFARRHGGRPHWGKEADFDPAYLGQRYERFDDFARLMADYDPDGKFRNPWLSRIFPQ